MRNIIIVMILAIGLIFTSFIKNKTRLLEKELVNLNIDIDKLRYVFSQSEHGNAELENKNGQIAQ